MFPRSNWVRAAIVAPALALVALTIVAACRDSLLPDSAESRNDARVTPRASLSTLTPAQRERLDAARARTRFVGDAHHLGMQVLIKSAVEHRRAKRPFPKKGAIERCMLLEQAGEVALAELDQNRGVSRSHAERLARIRQEDAVAQCSARGLTVFGLAATQPSLLAPQSLEEEVTGAYEAYVDGLQAVVQPGSSVAVVQAQLDGVLAQAVSASIPQGDLLALAAIAGLIESSAVEWTEVDWGSVGSQGCSTEDGCFAYSIFGQRWEDRVFTVVGADVGGCLAGVRGWGALKLLLAAPAWEALAGECGVRAAIGSGIAFIALF